MQPIPDAFLSRNQFQVSDPKDTNVRTAGDNPDGLPGDSPGGGMSSGAGCGCGCGCSCHGAGAGSGQNGAAGELPPEERFPYVHLARDSGYLIVRMKPRYQPDLEDVSPDQSLMALAQHHRLVGLADALTVWTTSAMALSPSLDVPPVPPSPDVPPVSPSPEVPLDPPSPQRFIVPSRPLVFNRRLPLWEPEAGPTWLPETLHRRLLRLEAASRTTPFPSRHSLINYWRVDLRTCSHLLETVHERLAGLAEVDHVYLELPALDPSKQGKGPSDKTLGPARYGEAQSYLDGAPVGIGARWARRRLGPSGVGNVRCLDLEQQWVLDHRDLPDIEGPWFGDNLAQSPYAPSNVDGHHGTAVLAMLIGGRPGDPDAGVQGLVDASASLAVTSHYVDVLDADLLADSTAIGATKEQPIENETDSPNEDVKVHSSGHVAEAIANALANPVPGVRDPLADGDILLLEVQRAYLPTEVDAADFDAIRLATSRGVLVVEAAGNGGLDLDAYVDEIGRRPLAREGGDFEDSGAVLVGAAEASLPHNRAAFSNYGSRIECYGWGADVTTAGYGDLVEDDEPQNLYTNTFEGTSSAAPMVAGAAMLLLALLRRVYGAGASLPPWRLRQWLADPRTGTPQGLDVAGHIGVMPDLRSIGRGSNAALLPAVYLRRSMDSTCRAGVCISPDIFWWHQPTLHNARIHDVDAPTLRGRAKSLQVRVRNRGALDADPGDWRADLYRGPVATLIAPDQWQYVDSVKSNGPIPVGDLPQLLPPVDVMAAPPQEREGSLLAVLVDVSDDSNRSFQRRCHDWPSFLDSLDDDQLACNNVHDVKVPPSGSPSTLPFVLAGAWDRRLRFDFEVEQRLPNGVGLSLRLGHHLASTFLQRRSWHGGVASLGSQAVYLPLRHRLRFEDVALERGTAQDVSWQLTGSDAIQKGHSLVLRQLWQGREVGRITWRFWRN